MRGFALTRESWPVSKVFAGLAVSSLVSTVFLIMIGGIVRVTGYGLGCPDWPLCYGQAIPPLRIDAWVEFIHRLIGGVVVLQLAALIALALRHYKQQSWIYKTAVFASGALIVQVVLGGVHVIYELPRWTGWVHTALAMLIAGVAAVWVALTWPALQQLGQRTAASLRSTRLPFWTGVTAVFTYVLLLTGSLVTRSGASLVCPDFPACGLPIVPAYLQPFVITQLTHRFSAYIVAATICIVLLYLLRAARRDNGLRNYAIVLTVLLVLQFTLGIINVLFTIPRWSRVLHLGTGASIWAVVLMLWVTLQAGQQQLALRTEK